MQERIKGWQMQFPFIKSNKSSFTSLAGALRKVLEIESKEKEKNIYGLRKVNIYENPLVLFCCVILLQISDSSSKYPRCENRVLVISCPQEIDCMSYFRFL